MASAAITAGTATAPVIVAAAETQLNAASRGVNNGWEILGNWVGAYGTRYLGRSIVATDLLAANTPQQSIYPIADTDHTGRTLDGADRYTIRFPRGHLPPVKAFWSLTMYNASFFLAANPINRYAIGDRTSGLHYGADGSLTLYVQRDAPARSHRPRELVARPGRSVSSHPEALPTHHRSAERRLEAASDRADRRDGDGRAQAADPEPAEDRPRRFPGRGFGWSPGPSPRARLAQLSRFAGRSDPV